MTSSYNIVLSTNASTVVSEYEPEAGRARAYQSEADLEKLFIQMLGEQGYEYVSIKSESELIDNLRRQLESLNHYRFTDREWDEFYKSNLAGSNEGIVEKTRKIQEDFVQNLTREDARTQNITLIDKKNIHNNRLQVINQYAETSGAHEARYDVTILVNGFPLVHVELKRRGVAIKEAFNQISRYQRESFWAGAGLFEYVQIFVISNGTHTKYYSNTTRLGHIKEAGAGAKRGGKKTSDSFEFTSFWADGNNRTIPDLVDFTKTFFAKHTILNILTRYCVFTSEKLLLVMRPYQIAATERILSRIDVSSNYRKTGTIEAGGYVWHTTGSGKTLTSFKTAQLATKLAGVEKVLFVVDRRDLDYQTIKEYERFEKGAANGNKSTAVLQKQLEDETSRIIVTTIQKLDVFISKNKTHPIYQRHVVLVFDECHRSQFGEMHRRIVRHFRNYHIFGFTGTPIFAVNSASGGNPALRTTEQVFGEKLHTYTIVDAINDGNVLPFRIDYINTIKEKDGKKDVRVPGIDTEEALSAPERIAGVVAYVLAHFNQKTVRHAGYDLKGQRVHGFNSIFAASSIPTCKKYYAEFKKQTRDAGRDLAFATIFSYAPNEEDPATGLPANDGFGIEGLDSGSREFLEAAIADYNARFQTNFDTSDKGFQNYYKDLSQRVKNRELDLLLVVDMFLTGFDATTLNTLWVDKNLRMHGLLQAFSRTNRILNSVKTFGNIVCFRDLEKATNEAISLFGDKGAHGVVLLRSYDDYLHGYTDEKGKREIGYSECLEVLFDRFPLDGQIVGEKNEKDFIALFGSILRLRNILSAFDRFECDDRFFPIDFQDYMGLYHDLHDKYKKRVSEKDSILDDVVFEMELVKQVEVNIDYILEQVIKYQKKNGKDKEILVAIDKAIRSSLQLRSKKELIEAFIETVNVDSDVRGDWRKFVQEQKEKDLAALIEEENLKAEETRDFVATAFRDGVLKTTGTDLDRLMPPVSRFGGDGGRDQKKQTIIEKLKIFFDKYLGLVQA